MYRKRNSDIKFPERAQSVYSGFFFFFTSGALISEERIPYTAINRLSLSGWVEIAARLPLFRSCGRKRREGEGKTRCTHRRRRCNYAVLFFFFFFRESSPAHTHISPSRESEERDVLLRERSFSPLFSTPSASFTRTVLYVGTLTQ